MTVELVRIEPADRQVVQKYGAGGFTVSGRRFEGSVLVFPGTSEAWPAAAPADLVPDAFAGVIAQAAHVDLCLVGCGARMVPIPAAVRGALKEAGIAVEPMDTGAACRTFNMLIAEDRSVAAALIAV